MFGGWKSVGSGVLEFGAGEETWEHGFAWSMGVNKYCCIH